jgi:Mn2+/Fe2+ NRAMP family transporter
MSSATPQTHKPGWRETFAFGPGLVYLVSSIGPSDLITNSAAGANYGFSLIWVVLLSSVTMYVLLGATARYVLVTGESLLSGYLRVGKWVVWVILAFIVLKRQMSNMVHILLMGVALHMVAPLPTTYSEKIWSVAICASGFFLMYIGKYPAVEKVSRPLLFVLGSTVILAAVLSHPDPTEIAAGFLHPVLPPDTGFYSPVLVVMALLGTSVGSLTALKYSAFVYEKGWRRVEFQKRQHVDLLLAVGGMFVLAVTIQIAAASVLHPRGLTVESIQDLAPLFSVSLGDWGQVVLGICLWAASFTTYIGSNTGYTLMAADVYRRAIRGEESQGSNDPAFRFLLVWFCVSPMYVLWTDWKPVAVALLTGMLFVVLLPLILFALLKITNDKKLMGEHTNGWFSNVYLVVFGLGILVVTLQEGTAIFAELVSRL